MLTSHRYVREELDCPWTWDTAGSAARVGYFDCVAWLVTAGCPTCVYTCAYAAERGHLAILQWLRAQGVPWDAMTVVRACQGDHLEAAKWAAENGCPWNTEARDLVLKKGGDLAWLTGPQEADPVQR